MQNLIGVSTRAKQVRPKDVLLPFPQFGEFFPVALFFRQGHYFDPSISATHLL